MKVYWNYNDYSQKAKATFYFFFSWWRFTCSSPPQWREESGWWRRHAEVQLKCDIQHIAPVAKCDYHNQRVSWQLPRPRSAERRTDWLPDWLDGRCAITLQTLVGIRARVFHSSHPSSESTIGCLVFNPGVRSCYHPLSGRVDWWVSPEWIQYWFKHCASNLICVVVGHVG